MRTKQLISTLCLALILTPLLSAIATPNLKNCVAHTHLNITCSYSNMAKWKAKVRAEVMIDQKHRIIKAALPACCQRDTKKHNADALYNVQNKCKAIYCKDHPNTIPCRTMTPGYIKPLFGTNPITVSNVCDSYTYIS